MARGGCQGLFQNFNCRCYARGTLEFHASEAFDESGKWSVKKSTRIGAVIFLLIHLAF